MWLWWITAFATINWKGRAIELLISGNTIDAQKACEFGLVNHVVKQDDLLNECKQFLSTVLTKGPLAVKLSIEAVNRGYDMSLEQGVALESELFGIISSTSDSMEGTAAFIEKRKAHFLGK